MEKLSGVPLNIFARDNIFEPLQMKNTTYKLTKKQLDNCAATEVLKDGVLIGTVHDPMARVVMKGVSANAEVDTSVKPINTYIKRKNLVIRLPV